MVQRKNVSIHGTFTSKASRNFDEYNLEAKKYNVKGTLAYPLETMTVKEKTSVGNKRKHERRHKNLNFKSTRNKAIIISDNFDGGRLKSVFIGSMDKRKGLMRIIQYSCLYHKMGEEKKNCHKV